MNVEFVETIDDVDGGRSGNTKFSTKLFHMFTTNKLSVSIELCK